MSTQTHPEVCFTNLLNPIQLTINSISLNHYSLPQEQAGHLLGANEKHKSSAKPL
jgi:hypothetical protein